MNDETIKIPDIGSGSAEIIEICVASGDSVSADDSLIVLESDKASMEVPAPRDGQITEILVKVGDSVSEGDDMLKMAAAGAAAAPAVVEEKAAPAPVAAAPAPVATPAPAATSSVQASSIQEVQIPDIGAENVPVIEICVAVGDEIAEEDSLVVLETDKATMEVPSPFAGVIKEICVKEGDAMNQGDLVVKIETTGGAVVEAPVAQSAAPVAAPASAPAAAAPVAIAGGVQDVTVPDIGGDDVPVIEICVAVGDEVAEEDSLVVLESDKATMEVPSPFAGVIKEICVKEGDKMSQGSLIVKIETKGGVVAAAPVAESAAAPAAPQAPAPAAAPAAPAAGKSGKPSAKQQLELEKANRNFHAGPAVRKLAREFGVDLSLVKGTGPRSRIIKEDVQAYVKAKIQEANKPQAAAVSGGAGIPPVPAQDYGKWGEIEEVALNRLRKVAARNFQRSWLNVPHVTQFDEADITELEAFRKANKAMAEKKGTKLTPLPFFLKAVAYVLAEMPQFCTSLSEDGESVIYKKYINIGVAVDTPDGLLVPVLKNVDQKGIWELSRECIELAGKARDKKLKPDEMQGGCFTISSLGSIGGTAFTPIVNAPEVAILGISKAAMKPVWNGKDFDAKLMCPLSLSYDHRVINGADAARFTSMLGNLLADIRMLLL
ncbi:pyruvate dehydrogenase complex dihydrolipoyllysine-residue acetyltransferase [Endozoicomonas sp. OPT23]|uniref:pyruvate dehydrogenase complex dihydrolipoyllysine-residue acetyltransferase n=1 Tax=Endozoicomonas sp. OPT23 TaxID=2072845 RepID=UPI00129B6485|nr:pyruvate dehydrogenase complex dihydrolipoyllysine-residue acetyltransferase [Endozoicomonas sp. OPT23]MRI31629.1 pyruvate dehydrogenase complex dihydrolipoyllysine-residue acetyltransferase [Endozoicomonas sp. OPT23]